MKIKQNITGIARILITPHIMEDGTKFDLEALDATGKAIEGTKITSRVIHDAQAMRMGLGKSFSVDGKKILSKIQLVPTRQDDNSVVVEVKVLFTPLPTAEEIDAMLLTRGKEGQLQLNYKKISNWLVQYKLRVSHYPKISLDLDMTYYWKINEVNMAETPTTLDGDLWSFTTQQYLVVDDFESYNDLDPTEPESNRIFNAWIDGYEQPTNGSLVGYDVPPFTWSGRYCVGRS
ncbi:hypothetical protein ES703_18696 [subsurface metagenome]